MACPKNCNVWLSPDQENLEAIGFEALAGTISWREAERRAGVSRQSLKTHMENHVVAPEVAAAQAEQDDELDRLVEEARKGLIEAFAFAPPDVKPLFLVAIQNLDGLRQMKPSAAELTRALKTIQEMTGMKNEQRMLLDFAAARQRLRVVNHHEPKELPA